MALFYIRSLFLICQRLLCLSGPKLRYLPYQAVGSDLPKTRTPLSYRVCWIHVRSYTLTEDSYQTIPELNTVAPRKDSSHLSRLTTSSHISSAHVTLNSSSLIYKHRPALVLKINTQWNRCCFLDTHLPWRQRGCQNADAQRACSKVQFQISNLLT